MSAAHDTLPVPPLSREHPDWFKTVARINPFTALLDGTRSILSASTDLLDLALGIGAFAAIGVITYGLAARSYAGLVTAD